MTQSFLLKKLPWQTVMLCTSFKNIQGSTASLLFTLHPCSWVIRPHFTTTYSLIAVGKFWTFVLLKEGCTSIFNWFQLREMAFHPTHEPICLIAWKQINFLQQREVDTNPKGCCPPPPPPQISLKSSNSPPKILTHQQPFIFTKIKQSSNKWDDDKNKHNYC